VSKWFSWETSKIGKGEPIKKDKRKRFTTTAGGRKGIYRNIPSFFMGN